jgi:hypothetical protein
MSWVVRRVTGFVGRRQASLEGFHESVSLFVRTPIRIRHSGERDRPSLRKKYQSAASGCRLDVAHYREGDTVPRPTRTNASAKSLAEGSKVEFEAAGGPKGPQGTNVVQLGS